MASRSCRLSAEIRRVVAVITRSGRSTRPATTQPAATDTTTITPSAIADPSRYWCDVAVCACTATVRPCCAPPLVTVVVCEVEDPTPLVMASSTTADSTNRTQYRAVKRIRTVRRDRSIIATSHSWPSHRPGTAVPASACPAGPYNDITAAVRPV